MISQDTILNLYKDIVKVLQVLLDKLQQQKSIPPTPPKMPQETSKPSVPTPTISAAQRLYLAAKSQIGNDLSKSAPNELGCSEAMSRVIKMVYPNFPIILSTTGLNLKLMNSYHFERSANPIKGCIAIAPTQGARVGHVWVWGEKWAMSNTSKTGKWQANYLNVDVIKDAKRRGLPLLFYIPL